MSEPSRPSSDPPVPSAEDEDLEGFYQPLSLDELFGGPREPQEEEEGSGQDAPAGPGVEELDLDLGLDVGEPSDLLKDLPLQPPDPRSLAGWVALYYRSCAAGRHPKTEAAKRVDMEAFLNFYLDELGHDLVEGWVPELTARYQRVLQATRSPHTGRLLSPATVDRRLATVRHFAGWLASRRELPSGDPCRGVRRLVVPRSRKEPSRAEVRRLWRACLERLESCHRRDQNPLLEAAVFQLLTTTDLRPHQLSALDLEDYRSKKLHGAFRQGRKVVREVWIPAEARRWLERYLDEVRGRGPGALLLSRTGERLQPRGVARIMERLTRLAG